MSTSLNAACDLQCDPLLGFHEALYIYDSHVNHGEGCPRWVIGTIDIYFLNELTKVYK